VVRGLETFLAVLVLGAATAPGAADHVLREVAVCARRLSATMEDPWMFDGPGSERIEAELLAMVALIEASMAPGQGREVVGWRVNAKVAAARAEALAAECRTMILS
jgi:hypothetical protein